MNPNKSQEDVLAELLDLSHHGVRIIPLIGAGFSVDAGLPTATDLTRYLAKVKHFVEQRIYKPPTRRQPMPRSQWTPSDYLRTFGWPNPGHLTADLSVSKNTGEAPGTPLWRHELLVQNELISLIRNVDERFVANVTQQEKEEKEHIERQHHEQGQDPDFSRLKYHHPLWQLKGDWNALLHYLVAGDLDLVDTLFYDLLRGRKPGMGHRVLAFLAHPFNLRLILTINFDNLIEHAFRDHGISPVIYDVLRDATLPHPSLLKEDTSIIKLHGGSYGLTIGERLNYQIDREQSGRLRDYFGPEARLVVLGIGGWERRVRQIVEAALRDRPLAKAHYVYWLHYEETLPAPVADICQAYPRNIVTARVRSPGAFLFHLYCKKTSDFPPSRSGYPIRTSLPLCISPLPATKSNVRTLFEQGYRLFSVVETSPLPCGRPSVSSAPVSVTAAPLQLADLLSDLGSTHHSIWLDAESMSTVPELVEELISQIRLHDPSIPPVFFFHDQSIEGQNDLEKAVHVVFRSLRRGHYALAFNAVDAFARPPNRHHHTHGHEAHGKNLKTFLSMIWNHARSPNGANIGDSVIAISHRTAWYDTDPPQPRLEAGPWSDRDIPPERGGAGYKVLTANALPSHVHNLDEPSRLAAGILAAFRRRRNITSARAVLSRLMAHELAREHNPDALLAQTSFEAVFHVLAEAGVLVALEDGSYWMPTATRDYFYEYWREGVFTSPSPRQVSTIPRLPVRPAMEAGADGTASYSPAGARAILMAAVHREIGRQYYFGQYVSSRDFHSLSEALYHLVACARYSAHALATLQDDEAVERYLQGLGVRRGAYRTVTSPHSDPTDRTDRTDRTDTSIGAAIVTLGSDLWHQMAEALSTVVRILDREDERLLAGMAPETLYVWSGLLRADLRSIDGLLARADRSGLPGNSLADKVADLQATLERKAYEVAASTYAATLQVDNGVRSWGEASGIAWARSIRTRPEAEPVASAEALIEPRCATLSVGKLIVELLGASRSSPGRSQWLARHLIEVLRGYGRIGASEAIAEIAVKLGQNGALAATERLPIAIRHAGADALLRQFSSWGTAAGASRGSVQELCERAERLCTEGLRACEDLDRRAFRVERSRLFSLRARSRFLRGGDDLYGLARADLDRAVDGLNPENPTERQCIAIALLRLSELLLSRISAIWGAPEQLAAANRGDFSSMQKVRSRLLRVRDVLERCGELLPGVPRDAYWWCKWLERRAQWSVELLLLLVEEQRAVLATEHEYLAEPATPRGVPDCLEATPSEIRADTETREGRRQRGVFIGSFQKTLKVGLLAVRGGLDVAFARATDAEPGHRKIVVEHEEILLRAWLGLMIGGWCANRLGVRPDRRAPKVRGLWVYWAWLNRGAGITRIVRGSAPWMRRKLAILDRRFEGLKNAAGRQDALEGVDWLIKEGAIEQLQRAKERQERSTEPAILLGSI